MHALLEQIYQSSEVLDAQGASINPFPAATPREVAQMLASFVSDHDCHSTLEMGMAYALSTLAICNVHELRGSGRHIAIDPVQSTLWKNVGLLNIDRAGLKQRLTFFEASSHEALPRLLEQKEQLDFAFIDGAHLFDYAFVDLFYIDKLLRTGGLIVFDDLWMPAIRRVVSFAATNLGYEVPRVPNPGPFITRAARVLRRYAQDTFGADPAGTKRMTSNICLMRKRSSASESGISTEGFECGQIPCFLVWPSANWAGKPRGQSTGRHKTGASRAPFEG